MQLVVTGVGYSTVADDTSAATKGEPTTDDEEVELASAIQFSKKLAELKSKIEFVQAFDRGRHRTCSIDPSRSRHVKKLVTIQHRQSKINP